MIFHEGIEGAPDRTETPQDEILRKLTEARHAAEEEVKTHEEYLKLLRSLVTETVDSFHTQASKEKFQSAKELRDWFEHTSKEAMKSARPGSQGVIEVGSDRLYIGFNYKLIARLAIRELLNDRKFDATTQKIAEEAFQSYAKEEKVKEDER